MKSENDWYIKALKDKVIDYWNFNCCIRKKTPWVLIAARTKIIAKGLGLYRIKRYNNIYYGILKRI